LRIILKDTGTEYINYWYICYNLTQQRRKPAGNHNNGGRLSPSAPFAPEADDDNSTSKGIGIYPMKLDYIPNPRAGPGAPTIQAIVRHEPWKQGDTVAWQAKMPRLRDDAEKCTQLLSVIITDYFPN